MEAFVNGYLLLAYLFLGIAVVAIIALPLIKSLDNPKSLVEMGVGILGLGVLFLISWLVSGSEVTEVYAKHNVGPEMSKVVGGVLTLMYILSAVAIVGIIVTELKKLFK